jgi:hypothetical protein
VTPFEYVGQWWLPETPDASCFGTLRFDGNDSPRLKLSGSLRPLAGRGFGGGEPFAPDIILGFTENGKEVTLYRCHETNTVLSYPGIPSATYIADYAIVGCHLPTKVEVRFEKFWIRHDRLVEWTRLTGFKEQLDMDGNALRGIAVDWHEPAPYEVTIAGWQIKFSYGFHQHGDRLEHYNLQHHVALEVQPPEPKSIEGFQGEFANHYRNFVTLGVGTPIHTTDLKALPVPDADNPDSKPRPASIYHYVSRRDKAVGKIDEFKMLFSFPAIAADYATCLQRWYGREELLRPVYNLYFGTLYSEPGYVETEFLLLAQALESYHSRSFDRVTYLGRQEFRRVRKALLKALKSPELILPAEVLDIYTKKLPYLNHLVLHTRIVEVVERLADAARVLIPDAVAFAKRVTDTRNYLTHYEERMRRRSAAGEDLWLLAQQVRFVLELCFLREMGLPDERIVAMASNHQQYLFLRSRLRQRPAETGS